MLEVRFIDRDIDISDLSADVWTTAATVTIERYWDGRTAPAERHAEVGMLWSSRALYVRFSAAQDEPLNVNADPQLKKKAIGLWDRDVCELFVAPDPSEPRRYLEFEAAPTGEWIDLAIDLTSGERQTDWNYASGMRSAARIADGNVEMAMRIPWTGLGKTPAAGDVWAGNLFRCVGNGESRGYLAWQPTMTKQPDFHMPERFGKFGFAGNARGPRA